MSDLLDLARAHFDAMRRKTLDIPEWGLVGDKAAFYDPPTLATRQAVQDRAGRSTARQFALTLILCLKDKDGNPIFEDNAISLTALTGEVDPAVVTRAYNAIMASKVSEADLGNS